jgi:hypothetical protein
MTYPLDHPPTTPPAHDRTLLQASILRTLLQASTLRSRAVPVVNASARAGAANSMGVVDALTLVAGRLPMPTVAVVPHEDLDPAAAVVPQQDLDAASMWMLVHDHPGIHVDAVVQLPMAVAVAVVQLPMAAAVAVASAAEMGTATLCSASLGSSGRPNQTACLAAALHILSAARHD